MSKSAMLKIVALVWKSFGILAPMGIAPKEVYFVTYLPGSVLYLAILYYEFKKSKD